MPKFRKKPVVIDAMQFYSDNTELVLGLWARPDQSKWLKIVWRLRTLEGVVQARLDDWIIKGVAGEFYPCKPDIFAAAAQ